MRISERDKEFLRSLRGREHWKEDQARRALHLLEASGSSRVEFARRHDLTPSRLAWWSRRLRNSTGEPARPRSPGARGAFVELVPSSGAETVARVRLGRVEVGLSTLDTKAARFVMELAQMMESDPCC